jgi:1-acyl-sn-glycerol-3-phosphate acyltransferase
MISSLVMLFSFVFFGFLVAIVFIPWTLVTGNVTQLYIWANRVVRLGLRLGGIRVVAVGRDKIPAAQSCIFLSNHVSNLDPLVLIPLIPGRTSIFLKRSLMKIPILGYAMRLGKFIPVDRGGSMEAARRSVHAAQEVIAGGLHITTFVEGTRSKDGRLLPFKKGPFFLAKETGAICIPITILGTEAMMKKGSLRVTPGEARVIFHPAVDPANYDSRETLMLAVRESIASVLPIERRSKV